MMKSRKYKIYVQKCIFILFCVAISNKRVWSGVIESGRDVTTKLWEKSSHVCHLKNHKKSYCQEVHDFLNKTYFSKIKGNK